VTRELTHGYLQSIELDPLPRFEQISVDGWVAMWRETVAKATDYDSFPDAWEIPAHEWKAKLRAAWARLAEYDRLTAERMASQKITERT
jgi:hypothetical protein